MIPTEVVVAALALIGSIAGSWFSNRKNNALMGYRMDQLERKVDRLDTTSDIQKLRERVARLEERMGGGE